MAGRAGRAGRPWGRAEHLARGRRTTETAGLDDEVGREAVGDGGWARVRRRRRDAAERRRAMRAGRMARPGGGRRRRRRGRDELDGGAGLGDGGDV